jgi:uncharacterized membrane protein YdbT with pleckstrin-like domain
MRVTISTKSAILSGDSAPPRRSTPVPYPDQLLADDEQVVKHLHPHWITLFVPTVAFLVVAAAGGFVAAIVPAGSLQTPLRIAIAVVGVLILIWTSFIPFLRWRTTHYVLTTHRVLIRVGILHHRGRDIAVNRINDVSFEQTIWERIIGAGTLMVESAGEAGQQVLRDIPHAPAVQQLINRLIEGDHDRRTRDAAHYEAQYEAEYEARAAEQQRTERFDDR